MKNELKDNMLEQVSGGISGAPELPAAELAGSSYKYRFDGMDDLVPKDAGQYRIGIDISEPGNYTPVSPEIPGFSIMDKE